MNTLIVFAKNPIKGLVKTRIARHSSEELALKCYQGLLEHTLRTAKGVEARKLLYFSDFIPEESPWSPYFELHLQRGQDLGERMKRAFQYAFERGSDKVIIIGSDCLELTDALIKQAFRELDESEIVIGPSRDGGYYLLGMTEYHPTILDKKTWSSPKLLSETLRSVEELKLHLTTLPTLKDIDKLEDMPSEMIEELS